MKDSLLRVEKLGQMTRQGVCLGCGKIFDAGYAGGQAAEDRIKLQFEEHDCTVNNGKRQRTIRHPRTGLTHHEEKPNDDAWKVFKM